MSKFGICHCSCHEGFGIHAIPCCSSCEECGENISNGFEHRHKIDCLFNSIVGMEIEAAQKIVESKIHSNLRNYSMRITKVDGKAHIVTCDFRMDRLNVEVVDGKISKVIDLG